MTIQELLEKALAAAGGYEQISAIESYRAEMRREMPTRGQVSTMMIWRAAGGRIRIEEFSRGGRTVRIVNGDTGMRLDEDGASAKVVRAQLPADEVMTIRRDARVAPRNMLAHARKYHLVLGGLS